MDPCHGLVVPIPLEAPRQMGPPESISSLLLTQAIQTGKSSHSTPCSAEKESQASKPLSMDLENESMS